MCLAVGALALAACAPKGSAGADPSDALTAAVEKTLDSGSVRVAYGFSVRGAGVAFEIGGDAEVAFDPPTLHMSVEWPSFGPSQAAGEMEMILTDEVAYLRAPLLKDALGVATPWVSVDAATLGAASAELPGAGAGMSDPTRALRFLEGVTEVTEEGADTIDGRPATLYRATVDLAKALRQAAKEADVPASAGDQMRELERQLGSHSKLPIDVWVADGYVVRVRVDYSIPSGQGMAEEVRLVMTANLSDFGATFDISPPPADEVTDVTKLVAAASRPHTVEVQG